jgi:hypothetical protein
MENLKQENIKLQEENARLKITIQELETKLKKYINNEAHKKYYENHKQEIKQQQSKYIEKLREENPDKIKEYWKRAYQKRKEKKIQEQNIQETN